MDSRTSHNCHLHGGELLSGQPLTKQRRKGGKGSWNAAYRGGRVERVLPTRDQHRREIASNLWVRLITGECSSFDSSLFLRPRLRQTSFQRRGERESRLSYAYLFLHRPNSSAPLRERLRACILISDRC